jgi:hypothetical protein
MSQYLEAEAARGQNETMMRLAVVTTFGLTGTIATGFLGMNLFSHSDQPPEVKLVIFAAVFVPTVVLTVLYGGQVSAPLGVPRCPIGREVRTSSGAARLLRHLVATQAGSPMTQPTRAVAVRASPTTSAQPVGAAGLDHPSQLCPHHFMRPVAADRFATFAEIYQFLKPRELLSGNGDACFAEVWVMARADGFAPRRDPRKFGKRPRLLVMV